MRCSWRKDVTGLQNIFSAFILLLLVTQVAMYVFNGNQREQNVSRFFMTTGLFLITTSVKTFDDRLLDTVQVFMGYRNSSMSSSPDYLLIALGIVLIFFGYQVGNKVYVLNMIGRDRRLISENEYSKQVGLSDYKVKETEIPILPMFQVNATTVDDLTKNLLELVKIQVQGFKKSSTDSKKAFTGTAPIPFTAYAGTCLTEISFNDYYEYDKRKKRFMKLLSDNSLRKTLLKKQSYPKMTEREISNNPSSPDLVLVISTTDKVKEKDLVQFDGCSIIVLETEKIGDNTIKSTQQLLEYVDVVENKINEMNTQHDPLSTIHLIFITQSSLVMEIGRRVRFLENRIPETVVYHYVRNSVPRYPFGIVISEKMKGKVIKCADEEEVN